MQSSVATTFQQTFRWPLSRFVLPGRLTSLPYGCKVRRLYQLIPVCDSLTPQWPCPTRSLDGAYCALHPKLNTTTPGSNLSTGVSKYLSGLPLEISVSPKIRLAIRTCLFAYPWVRYHPYYRQLGVPYQQTQDSTISQILSIDASIFFGIFF